MNIKRNEYGNYPVVVSDQTVARIQKHPICGLWTLCVFNKPDDFYSLNTTLEVFRTLREAKAFAKDLFSNRA